MDKRNNAYLYITCFIVSIGGLLLGISANVSGASMYFGDFFGLQSGSPPFCLLKRTRDQKGFLF